MTAPTDTCGCCAGVTHATPEAPANAPGRSRLAWRAGTHGSIKASMLASTADQPALAGLKTRADDDPAVGLMDAWATALDVLTFYDERYANEAYLRTATERRSVLELARAIGYELSPGVAASVDLAFTVESAPGITGVPGAPASVQVPVGIRAQSIPGQDELPQTFETLSATELRPEWNELRPRQTEPFFPRFGDTHLYLQGTATNLKPGDAILLIGDERLGDPGSERWDCRRLSTVVPDPKANRTLVTWTPGLGIITDDGRKILPTSKNPKVYALRARAALFGHNAPDPADIIDADSVRGQQAKPTLVDFVTKAAKQLKNDVGAPYVAQVAQDFDQALGKVKTAINALHGPVSSASGDASAALEVLANMGLSADGGRNALDSAVDPASNATIDERYNALKGGFSGLLATMGDDLGTLKGLLGTAGPTLLPALAKFGVDVSTAYVDLQLAGAKNDLSLVHNTIQALGKAADALDASIASAVSGGQGASSLPATPDTPFAANAALFFLDTTYPQVTAESWIVLASPDYAEVYRVKGVSETSLARYHITGKATRLQVEGENADEFTPRSATVLCASEELAVAEAPIASAVGGDAILLDRSVAGLQPGRRLLLTGIPEGTSVPASEAADLLAAVPDGSLTRLDLAAPLQRSYQRGTVTLNANVVPASHGETKREILGSGNAAQASQAFVLKGVPLTYTSAATPSGSLSSLQIRVNGLLWQEGRSFYDADAGDRRYTVRLADDGKATVRFGDGTQGERLPSGSENVEATYRIGTGAAGLVDAGQISLLMDRVLGLKSVLNPLAPVGAEDPETLDQARGNAPVTVLTLERIVSLSDFADFARSFAGIAKAAATWLWDGERRLVHLTIAGENGTLLDAASKPYQNLLTAMDQARDPNQPVRVGNYRPVACTVAAKLYVAADQLLDAVQAAARAALLERFAFAARDLAQGITSSEAIALLQGVPGVVWVDLDRLDRAPGSALKPRLPAQAATWSGGDILGAELLTLADADISLTAQFAT